MVVALLITAISPFAGAVAATSDTEAPVLAEFDFSPKSVDVSAGSQDVAVTLRITDELAGLDYGYVGFGTSENPEFGSFIGDADRTSGDEYDGVYVVTVTIPQYAASGTWHPRVLLVDDLGNSKENYAADLSTAGFPTDLEVNPTVPTAPRDVSAVAGDSQVTVSWTAPADDGGPPVTKYTVTADDGVNSPTSVTVDAPATSVTVSALANGTTYDISVVASNSEGDGPPSGLSRPRHQVGAVVAGAAAVGVVVR